MGDVTYLYNRHDAFISVCLTHICMKQGLTPEGNIHMRTYGGRDFFI